MNTIPDTNPNGGCVGVDWRDWWFNGPPEEGWQECNVPANPRTCPTSVIFSKHRMHPSKGTRLYCDEHWQQHLEKEEAWLLENDPRIKKNNNKEEDSFYLTDCLDYLHPDELPGPLTNEYETLAFEAIIVLSGIAIIIVPLIIWLTNR